MTADSASVSTFKRKPDFGELAPFFTLPCGDIPQFHLSSVGGRWLVLLFHGSFKSPTAKAAHDLILESSTLFNDQEASFFVGIDPDEAPQSGRTLGLRYFRDLSGAISRGYGVTDGTVYMPTVFLLDRMMRVVCVEPASQMSTVLRRLESELAAERARKEPPLAPVLTIPNIFEPEFCRALIAHYQAVGGEQSGHMTQIAGRTVGVLDTRVKRRKDAIIPEGPLRDGACSRISNRLIPAVARFLGWRATRIERYIVACYADEDKGFFRMHRDNTTNGTAHRKFAVSINLNAEDYDGGELRFPEFGSRTYKPPTGGATVFACGVLHEATPVTRGVRYAFLPFLYDEEGRKIREANMSLVDARPLGSS